MMPDYDGCELHSISDSCLMAQDRERERHLFGKADAHVCDVSVPKSLDEDHDIE